MEFSAPLFCALWKKEFSTQFRGRFFSKIANLHDNAGGGGGGEMTKIGLFPKIELSPSKGRINCFRLARCTVHAFSFQVIFVCSLEIYMYVYVTPLIKSEKIVRKKQLKRHFFRFFNSVLGLGFTMATRSGAHHPPSLNPTPKPTPPPFFLLCGISCELPGCVHRPIVDSESTIAG